MVLRPYVQLLFLLGLVFLLGSLVTTLAAYSTTFLFGIGDWQTFAGSITMQSEHPYAFLYVQGMGAIGTFLLPALLFVQWQGRSFAAFYRLQWPVVGSLVLLAVLVLFFSQSIIALTSQWNMQLPIPSGWGAFGDWLRNSHDSVQQGYRSLLTFHSFGHFLLALLVVAVLPAIGEELIFRGGIQQLLQRWLGNPHIAVWTAAAIFSLFHLQVFFFLPRLILGGLLGYLYYWSRNIWYPILAHFFNNAWVLAFAYFFAGNDGAARLLEPDTGQPWPVVVVMTFLFGVFLVLFRKIAKDNSSHAIE